MDQPLLHVYLAPLRDDYRPGAVASAARNRLLARTRHPALLRQRTAVWRLLEEAVSSSLGLDLGALDFQMTPEGRWFCPGFHFALSHTQGAVGVAVSRAPVGLDLENEERFYARYGDDPGLCEKMLRRICAPAELPERPEAEALLRLWTGKESLFKAREAGTFQPTELIPGADSRWQSLDLPPRVQLAVTGEQIGQLQIFIRGE